MHCRKIFHYYFMSASDNIKGNACEAGFCEHQLMLLYVQEQARSGILWVSAGLFPGISILAGNFFAA